MNYGQQDGVICEPAQVIMHLPENWTKILLVRTYGLGLADGGAYWDIPTEVIPPHLRLIGSRFVILSRVGVVTRSHHGRGATSESLQVAELPEADKALWPECNQKKNSDR
jgi:hypothetical protein